MGTFVSILLAPPKIKRATYERVNFIVRKSKLYWDNWFGTNDFVNVLEACGFTNFP